MADPGAPTTERLATGDLFAVLDCDRGLAWGYRVADHRVGYVDLAAFTRADDGKEPTG